MTEKHEFMLRKWRGLISERQSSGMTIKEWCAANHISRHQYYYWLSKLRTACFEEEAAKLPSIVTAEKDTTPGRFVDVSPKAETAGLTAPAAFGSSPAAVLHCGNVSVELMPTAAAPFLRQLLEAVRYV